MTILFGITVASYLWQKRSLTMQASVWLNWPAKQIDLKLICPNCSRLGKATDSDLGFNVKGQMDACIAKGRFFFSERPILLILYSLAINSVPQLSKTQTITSSFGGFHPRFVRNPPFFRASTNSRFIRLDNIIQLFQMYKNNYKVFDVFGTLIATIFSQRRSLTMQASVWLNWPAKQTDLKLICPNCSRLGEAN